MLFIVFFKCSGDHRDLHVLTHAFPTRRSSERNSGPDAGFAQLFHNRWCILTPDERTEAFAVERLSAFWSRLGANVEVMDPKHHDLVLAVTSHLPHLIAYTIVGTASDMESVTRSEVIKYSAGGFRDFNRIAASRSEENQSELQSLMRISYGVFRLK